MMHGTDARGWNLALLLANCVNSHVFVEALNGALLFNVSISRSCQFVNLLQPTHPAAYCPDSIGYARKPRTPSSFAKLVPSKYDNYPQLIKS